LRIVRTSSQTVSFASDIEVLEVETEDSLLLLYPLKDIYEKAVLNDLDPLLRKAPFVLILFEKENAQVQTIVRRLEQRYQLDILFLSSRPAVEDVDFSSLKGLSTIPAERVIFYDSQDEQKFGQVLRKAQELFSIPTIPLVETAG